MAYTSDGLLLIWNKAQQIPGVDPRIWRKDACGAWINFNQYNGQEINLGYRWEVDHIIPESRGGQTVLPNLRPLQWENNRAKSDGYLVSKVTSRGSQNVYSY